MLQVIRAATAAGVRVILATGKARPAAIAACRQANLEGDHLLVSSNTPGVFLQAGAGTLVCLHCCVFSGSTAALLFSSWSWIQMHKLLPAGQIVSCCWLPLLWSLAVDVVLLLEGCVLLLLLLQGLAVHGHQGKQLSDAALPPAVVQQAFAWAGEVGISCVAFLGDECATLQLTDQLRELHHR